MNSLIESAKTIIIVEKIKGLSFPVEIFLNELYVEAYLLVDYPFFYGSTESIRDRAARNLIAIVSGQQTQVEKLQELHQEIKKYLNDGVNDDGDTNFKEYATDYIDILKNRYSNCLDAPKIMSLLIEPEQAELHYRYLHVDLDALGYQPLLKLDNNAYVSVKIDLEQCAPISQENKISAITIVYQSREQLIELFKVDECTLEEVQKFAEQNEIAKHSLANLSLTV